MKKQNKILYKNLFIRFFKTKYTYLFIIFALILAAIFPIFAQKSDDYYKVDFDPYYIEERYKADNDLQNMIWEADRDDPPSDIYETIYSLRIEAEFFNAADRMGLDIYNEAFIADALHDYAAMTVEKKSYDEKGEKYYRQIELDEIEKILTEHDFALYTSLKNERILASDITEEEKELSVFENDLYLMACKKGEYIRPEIKTAVNSALAIKKSLIENKDHYLSDGSYELDADLRSEYENELKILEYRLENSYLAPENSLDTAKSSVYLFEIFLLVASMIFANNFLQEKKDGTARFYLSQNITRRGYFYYGILSVISICAIFTIIAIIIASIGCLIFSPDFALPYIYLQNDNIKALAFGFAFPAKFILMFFKAIFLFSVCSLFAAITKSGALTNAITVIIFAFNIIKGFIPSLASNRVFALLDPAESLFPFDFGNKFILAPNILPLIFTIIFTALIFELSCRLFEINDI